MRRRNLLLVIVPWMLASILLYCNLNGYIPGFEGWSQMFVGIFIVIPFRWESFLSFIGEKIGREPSLRVRLNNLESHARGLHHLEDKVRENHVLLQEETILDKKAKEAEFNEGLRKMKTLLEYVFGEIDSVYGYFDHFSKIIKRLGVK